MLKLNSRGWKDIEGYEGLYQVHRKGYVRNASGLVMKTYLNNSDYVCIKLRKNRRSKAFLVHRLVALAFVKNRNLELFVLVNHEDGDKSNNYYKNLKWCDNSYNILHARRIGLNPYNKPAVGKQFGKTSKYHGVGYDVRRDKWYSGITHEKRCQFRKRFDTEVEAAKHFNWILKELKITDRPRNIIK